MAKALSSKPFWLRLLVFAILATCLVAITGSYFARFTWVTIYVEQEVYRRITLADNVGAVLGEIGLELRPEDYIHPDREQQLYRGMGIVVLRAQPYTVSVDGEIQTIWSVGKKVADILHDAGVEYYPQDVIMPPAESQAEPQHTITVVRVESRIVEEEVVVPYLTRRVPNPQLFRGQERVTQFGRDGIIIHTIQITYHDGEEVERTVLASEEVVAKQDRIEEYGTISSIVSRSGHHVEIHRVVDVLATAYCPGTPGSGCPIDPITGHSHCTGAYNNGRTSTGLPAKQGKGTLDDPYIIAVDPRVIPLGSLLYLRFPAGGVTTIHGRIITDGFALAADVGSAIKGTRIDILFDNHWVAWYFGRRQVRVFIVDKVTAQ